MISLFFFQGYWDQLIIKQCMGVTSQSNRKRAIESSFSGHGITCQTWETSSISDAGKISWNLVGSFPNKLFLSQRDWAKLSSSGICSTTIGTTSEEQLALNKLPDTGIIMIITTSCFKTSTATERNSTDTCQGCKRQRQRQHRSICSAGTPTAYWLPWKPRVPTSVSTIRTRSFDKNIWVRACLFSSVESHLATGTEQDPITAFVGERRRKFGKVALRRVAVLRVPVKSSKSFKLFLIFGLPGNN